MAKDSISKLRNRKKPKTVNIDHVATQLVKPFSGRQIKENEALRAFIPPLQQEELLLLEQSIRKEGVREPLLLWVNEKEEHILVDGYNRYHLIKKLEAEGRTVKYGVKYLDFADFEEAKDWMLQNQLGRRNLTNEQRSYLRGLRYLREKAKHGGDRKSSGQNDPLPDQGRFSEFLAKEFGVGEKTIRRDAEFARGIELIGDVNAVLKADMLAGRTKIKKASLQQMGKLQLKKLPSFKSTNDIEVYLQKLKNKQLSKDLGKNAVNIDSELEKFFKTAENKLKNASASKNKADIDATIAILTKIKEML